VREHRGDLLAAVLTIWRNWVARGRPQAAQGMGSFDRWARAVGGALAAAGIDGFRSNVGSWLGENEDDAGWKAHLARLHERWGEQWFTVAQVAAAVSAKTLLEPPVRPDPDRSLAQLLPYAYRGIRDRWQGDYRLVCSEGRASLSGGRKWSVERHDPAAGHDADDAPARAGSADPSSASSVSSDSTTEPQVTALAAGNPGALTMNPADASSVGGGTAKTPGQPGRTDDTDDQYADPERDAGWRATAPGPLCGECGDTEDSVIHAVCCLGQEPEA
jgi:hypothetical protein